MTWNEKTTNSLLNADEWGITLIWNAGNYPTRRYIQEDLNLQLWMIYGNFLRLVVIFI
jgi:hypothetical protein